MRSKGKKSKGEDVSDKAGKTVYVDLNLEHSFEFGFLCSVIRIDHYECGQRLEAVWRCLNALAEVIQSNVFIVLRDLLTKITDMRFQAIPPRGERPTLRHYRITYDAMVARGTSCGPGK